MDTPPPPAPNLPPYAVPQPTPVPAAEPVPAPLNTTPVLPEPSPTPASTIPMVQPTPPLTPTPPIPPNTGFEEQHTLSPVRRRLKLGALILLVVLLFGGAATALAELGLMPWLQFERLYGRTAVAGLWGGIPANNTLALNLLLKQPLNIPDNFSSQYNIDYTGSINPSLGSFINSSSTTSTNTDTSTDATTKCLNEPTTESSGAPALKCLDSNQNTPAPSTASKIAFNGHSALDLTFLNRYQAARGTLDFSHTIESSKTDISFNTEFILKDRVFYIKIPDLANNTVGGQLLTAAGVDPSLSGKYYQIPISEAAWNDWQNSITEANQSGLEQLSGKVDEAQIKAVIEALAPHIKRRGIERIGGKPATHYSISLTKDSLADLAVSLTQATAQPDAPAVTTEQIDQFKQYFNDFNLEYEFWIQSKTYMVVQSNLSLNLTSADFNVDLGTTTNSQAISADSVTITAPTAALILGSGQTDSTGARDATRKADLKQLAGYLDSYHTQTGKYPPATEPIALDKFDLSALDSQGVTVPVNGPNGTDDDYTYQTNADATTYQLSATLEECDTGGCTYTYPESATITPVEDLATPTGRDTQRKTDLSIISSSLKAYQQAKGSFPISATTAKLNDSNADVVKSLVPTYLQAILQDPQADLYYGYKSDGKKATLTSIIEDDTQTTCAKVASYCVYTVTVTP